MDKILELIDNVKEKLTDNEYKQIMDELASANKKIVSDDLITRMQFITQCSDDINNSIDSLIKEAQSTTDYLKIIADLTRERLQNQEEWLIVE